MIEQHTTQADPQVAQLRVLVVDDNRDAADTLAMILRIYGYATCVAYDGLAALAQAASFQPNAMVLDLGLPGLDGYMLAERFRQMPAFAETMLIALTAYRGEEYRCRTQQAGFDHYLVKPAELKLLKGLFQDYQRLHNG
ncbi:MAG TPA: response regulator [Pirellulales bacterium]|nr:response regulator [Pirellulales bacterium]